MEPPPLPRGCSKHHIVVLEAVIEMPTFDFPHSIDLYTKSQPHQVAERIKDATIVIACIVPVTPQDMDHAPFLGLLAIMAVGISWLDRHECARRNITVTYCPAGNVEAVAEHFFGLYFAVRKRTVQVHNIVTKTSKWIDEGTLTTLWPTGPPLGCKNEILGIIGYGTIGKQIKHLANALGFQAVLVSERRNTQTVREGRTPFDQVLARASVLCVCVPLSDETQNLISEGELRAMRHDALVINVARGGIVNESALAQALREGWIAGAAVDVFQTEPVGPGTSPLIPQVDRGEDPVPNLTICKQHISPGIPSPRLTTTAGYYRKEYAAGLPVPCKGQQIISMKRSLCMGAGSGVDVLTCIFTLFTINTQQVLFLLSGD